MDRYGFLTSGAKSVLKEMALEVLEADDQGRKECVDMAQGIFERWLEMTHNVQIESDREQLQVEQLQVLLAAVQAPCATRQ